MLRPVQTVVIRAGELPRLLKTPAKFFRIGSMLEDTSDKSGLPVSTRGRKGMVEVRGETLDRNALSVLQVVNACEVGGCQSLDTAAS